MKTPCPHSNQKGIYVKNEIYFAELLHYKKENTFLEILRFQTSGHLFTGHSVRFIAELSHFWQLAQYIAQNIGNLLIPCTKKTAYEVIIFQHRRCSSSHNSLRGITHSLTHSDILLRSIIKPYSLFPWCSMVFTSTQ